jgi:hypothetical protein
MEAPNFKCSANALIKAISAIVTGPLIDVDLASNCDAKGRSGDPTRQWLLTKPSDMDETHIIKKKHFQSLPMSVAAKHFFASLQQKRSSSCEFLVLSRAGLVECPHPIERIFTYGSTILIGFLEQSSGGTVGPVEKFAPGAEP